LYVKNLSVFFLVMLLAQQAVAEKQPVLVNGFKSENDATSYAIGASVGRNFKKDDFTVNSKLFIQGFENGLSGAKLKMSEQEFKLILSNIQVEMRSKMAGNRRDKGLQNKNKEAAFLAENAKKTDVVSLPSGVQYKVLKAGNGSKPMDSDFVEVNYRGTLLDGTEFDASLPGKPVNLKLAQLISGWKEAIKLMSTGSKWQLYIPSRHAYSEKGVGNDIGPNEMLIFEVELAGINK